MEGLGWWILILVMLGIIIILTSIGMVTVLSWI
jgi:hypothetical protein